MSDILYGACKVGDKDKVLEIINDERCKDSYFRYIDKNRFDNPTPLIISIINKHRDVTMLLLNSKYNVYCEYQTSSTKRTALMYAIMNGDDEIIVKLIKKRGVESVGHTDGDGKTALIYGSIFNRSTKILALLLRSGHSCPNHIDKFNYSALTYAIYNSNVYSVRLLSKYTSYEQLLINLNRALQYTTIESITLAIVKIIWSKIYMTIDIYNMTMLLDMVIYRIQYWPDLICCILKFFISTSKLVISLDNISLYDISLLRIDNPNSINNIIKKYNIKKKNFNKTFNKHRMRNFIYSIIIYK